MSSFPFSFDDSGGEALGSGLDASALDVSGSESLDDNLQSTQLGSSIDLGGVGVTEAATGEPSLEDQFNLSGVSDAIPSEFLDSGIADNNGTGSAPSVHYGEASVTHAAGLSGLFAGIGKFGSSIGQMFAPHAATTTPTLFSGQVNANPNRVSAPGIGASHALMVVGVVLLLGAVIVGGKYGVR